MLYAAHPVRIWNESYIDEMSTESCRWIFFNQTFIKKQITPFMYQPYEKID